MNNKKVFRFVLLIIWMAFIFFMSSMPGDISSEQSDFVLDILKMLGVDVSGERGMELSYIIRKIAHVSEYFILCILLYRVWEMYFSKGKALIFSFISAFLYAGTDEFHQYFVPGRVGVFKDVIIDSFGALIAIVIICIIKNKKVS